MNAIEDVKNYTVVYSEKTAESDILNNVIKAGDKFRIYYVCYFDKIVKRHIVPKYYWHEQNPLFKQGLIKNYIAYVRRYTT